MQFKAIAALAAAVLTSVFATTAGAAQSRAVPIQELTLVEEDAGNLSAVEPVGSYYGGGYGGGGHHYGGHHYGGHHYGGHHYGGHHYGGHNYGGHNYGGHHYGGHHYGGHHYR